MAALVLKRGDRGPWRELTRAEALAAPPELVLSIVHGDGDEAELAGLAGVRIVNVLSYWLASKPLPEDLLVVDLWFDGITGWPVTADE